MRKPEPSREELQQLLNHLLEVQEELRATLARELHNELGALLTGMSLDLSGLQVSPAGRIADFETALDSSRALLREAVNLKRRFIERLFPSTLELLGLGPALETLSQSVADEYGLSMQTTVVDVNVSIERGLGIDFYRVAEAALENVVRHATAASVEMALNQADDSLVLLVRDDGVGFDPAKIREGLGFRLMRHRLGRWGGEVTLDSRPGQGLTLIARARLPIT